MYSKKLIEYYNDKKNVGNFCKYNNIGTGSVGAVSCGDIIKLQILVSRDGFIIDSKFKTYGCGSAIASSSLISSYVKNKKIYQIFFIKNIYISQELNLPSIKLHCSVLVEEAVKSAANDYKNNYILYL